MSFDGDAEKLILALLGCAEVQRLRGIRQLGLTSLVFPGAEHSRFSHAVGAAFVMQLWMNRVERVQHNIPASLRLDRELRWALLAAALLHDIGHGPFSHLFEDVVPNARHHESWTEQLILDPEGDVFAALSAFSKSLPARVAGLIAHRDEVVWARSAVSGLLDVDRCDYLLRDSYMTGVAYGSYDLAWLLEALSFAEVPADAGRSSAWVLAIEGRKGIPPVETFFLARHHMYQQVYHHKATRAAECLLRSLFLRLAELVKSDNAPQMPRPVRAAIEGHLDREHFLALDDSTLAVALSDWSGARDSVVADLAGRLRRRQLFKTIPLDVDESQWVNMAAELRVVADLEGLRGDLYVALDVAEDTPFEESTATPDGAVWVARRHHPVVSLGEVSFALSRFRGESIRWPRLCFAGELSSKAETIVARHSAR